LRYALFARNPDRPRLSKDARISLLSRVRCTDASQRGHRTKSAQTLYARGLVPLVAPVSESSFAIPVCRMQLSLFWQRDPTSRFAHIVPQNVPDATPKHFGPSRTDPPARRQRPRRSNHLSQHTCVISPQRSFSLGSFRLSAASYSGHLAEAQSLTHVISTEVPAGRDGLRTESISRA